MVSVLLSCYSDRDIDSYLSPCHLHADVHANVNSNSHPNKHSYSNGDSNHGTGGGRLRPLVCGDSIGRREVLGV